MTELQIKERYERKAYRIIQYHIKDMLLAIPLGNLGISTYEALIASNITEAKVKAMLVELYYDIGKQAKKRFKIDKPKNILFNDEFLQEVLNFLNSSESGAKILSIQQTLIKTVVDQIKPFVSDEISLSELRDLIYRIASKSGTYYKWQALRIAVTETTTASNFAKFQEAQKSNLQLLKFWVSLKDKRVRHDHEIENGQRAELNEPFVMADGRELMYAGDPQGGASQVINCRCTIRFEAKRDKEGNLILKQNR